MILAQEYSDVAGDHPLNLGSTTQAFNAFCLTGEAKYAEHVVEYRLRVVIVMVRTTLGWLRFAYVWRYRC